MSTSKKTNRRGKADPPAVRCAIYTRKSTEEGLEQEFNSLDAQWESAEAYITSQKSEGWTVLPERYDDGGYSGGSMERPALERLLRDIQAGKIDCVIVYKVDRLSRSLLDFARILETFERHSVAFVSVTQQFNTTTSMGRLMLNVLLSFAQFEREIIGERIRDKIAAQKRKGRWTGGIPALGYDVDRTGPSPRLVINADEAARVREIFQLYLEMGSLLSVSDELDKRGWVTKIRSTRKGATAGGLPFDKAKLYALLTNRIYLGKIVHKGEIFDGVHEPIIDADMFDRVQRQLKSNGRCGGAEVRNRYGALLRGLLRCKTCDSAMTHSFTKGRKGQFYRYYRCVRATKSGHRKCSGSMLPAHEIERIVIDEIRSLASDKSLLQDVHAQAMATMAGEMVELQRNRDEVKRDRERYDRELRQLATEDVTTASVADRLAHVHERIADAERRLPQIDARIAELERETITDTDVETAFAQFDTLWDQMSPREQARLLNLLVASVEYDGAACTVSVTFRPTNIKTLIRQHLEDAA